MVEFQALIMYGDGLQALYYDEKSERDNREGVRVRPMLVVPSKEIVDRFSLDKNDLNIVLDDGRRGLWVEYPIHQIEWLNRSKTGAVILIYSTFEVEHTPLMDKMEGMFEWTKVMDSENDRLRAALARLTEKLDDAYVNQEQVIMQQKALFDVVREKTRDDDEGGET